jgi:signal transduction histidine kinase
MEGIPTKRDVPEFAGKTQLTDRSTEVGGQRTDRLLLAVARCAELLLREPDADKAILEVLQVLGMATWATRVELYRAGLDPATGAKVQRLALRWRSERIRAADEPTTATILDKDLPQLLNALRRGEAFVYQDNTAGPGALRDHNRAIGTLSFIGLGIFVSQAFWGGLTLDSDDPQRTWSPTETAGLLAAASSVGAALERARLGAMLRAVSEIAESLLSRVDWQAQIHPALGKLAAAAGLHRAFFHRFDHSINAGFCEAEWSAAGVPSVLSTNLGAGPYGYAEFKEVWDELMAGRPYAAATRSKTGANADLNQQAGVVSDIFVPIFVQGRFWGDIAFDDCENERHWSDSEIAALKSAAAAIAAAIERDCAEQEKERRLKRRHQLSEVTTLAVERLAAEPELLAGMRNAARAMREGAVCDRVFITQVADNRQFGKLLVDEHAANVPSVADIVPSHNFDVRDVPEVVQALGRGEVLFSTVATDKHGRDLELNRALGTLHELMVPILVDGQLWGCIGFDDCSADVPFSEADALVLRSAAAGVAAAIQRDRAEQAREASRQALADEQQARADHLASTNALLSQSLRVLADNATPQSVIEEIARLILDTLGGQSSAVFQIVGVGGPEGAVRGGVILDRGQAAQPDTQSPLFDISLHDIPAWPRIRESSQATLLRLPQDRASIHAATAEFMEHRQQRWLLNLPLIVNGKPLWILAVSGTDDNALTQPNLERFGILAEQLKLALELKRLGEEAAFSAVVEDRARLAGEIHDSLAQAFVGTLLLMRAARDAAAAGSDQADDLLLRAELLTKEGLAQSRRSVLALRPPALENASLPEALALLARKASVPGYVECRYEGPEQCRFHMPPEHEDQLFRVAQEAVQNTLKHASARQIAIRIEERESCIELSIRDDGVGFSCPQPDAWAGGLAQMRARAASCEATLDVSSQLGTGTAVVLTWQSRVVP